MNCDAIQILISEYLDNELPPEKEGSLFTHLAGCQECRKEFRDQGLIHNQVQLHMHKIPGELEEKMYNSIKNRNAVFSLNRIVRPAPVYISYGLGFAIIILMIFSFLQIYSLKNDVSALRNGYHAAMERVQYQNQQMNLMMNTMPAVQISGHPIEY
jgi:predicted anti-sigma-YlaC factor YlaD